MRGTRLALFVVACLWVLTPFQRTHPASVRTDALMAVYTYNFAKFTEWPASAFDSPNAPLNLCLLGEHPFGVGSLSVLVGKKVRNHPIAIRPFYRVGLFSECHIVFVGRSEGMRLESVFDDLAGLPVLTVSDIPEFSRKGGMITFVTTEQRLRFDINSVSANEAGLRISSKLLEVARTLTDQSNKGR